MSAPAAPHSRHITVLEPGLHECVSLALPPEGNVKVRNYRVVSEGVRAYTPTGDVHTSPDKGKLVARFETTTAPTPRARILELVRPEDPGREALEAIVRPAAPRRGLVRPLDEDTRRFLQRVLNSPSPYFSSSVTPEPAPAPLEAAISPALAFAPESMVETERGSNAERSLADELKEAEEGWCGEDEGAVQARRGLSGGWRAAVERERLGRLALAVEEDEEEGGLGAAARRLDALLAESRDLHLELAGIHRDLQAQSARACRCAAAARALTTEACALRYLDDIVALLRGDVASAMRTRQWPFAIGRWMSTASRPHCER